MSFDSDTRHRYFAAAWQAVTDTVLVLAIVASTGLLLLGVNFVLTQAAEAWYHKAG